MPTIELDQRTADQLNSLATASGMSVDAYLRSLLAGPANVGTGRLSPAELERLLRENAFDGPGLPPDFSRADIYNGHA
jgi:hypothetical protein